MPIPVGKLNLERGMIELTYPNSRLIVSFRIDESPGSWRRALLYEFILQAKEIPVEDWFIPPPRCPSLSTHRITNMAMVFMLVLAWSLAASTGSVVPLLFGACILLLHRHSWKVCDEYVRLASSQPEAFLKSRNRQLMKTWYRFKPALFEPKLVRHAPPKRGVILYSLSDRSILDCY